MNTDNTKPRTSTSWMAYSLIVLAAWVMVLIVMTGEVVNYAGILPDALDEPLHTLSCIIGLMAVFGAPILSVFGFVASLNTRDRGEPLPQMVRVSIMSVILLTCLTYGVWGSLLIYQASAQL